MINPRVLTLTAGLCVCLGTSWSATAAAPAQTVAVCDDENELPPFSYYERVGGKPSTVIGGYAASVVREIFARRGVAYSIEFRPWTRCLAVTTLGQQYSMVMNLTYSVEREKNFLLTRSYASITSYYYYSRSKYPNGLAVSSAADLHNYRVCGIRGHNYEGYGMVPGEVDQGAKDVEVVISKLKLGRCTLFLEKDEIMAGYAVIGKSYLADPDIGKAPVPGMKPGQFHFGISKRYAQAEELRKLIDEELLYMEANGRLAELWKKAERPASR